MRKHRSSPRTADTNPELPLPAPVDTAASPELRLVTPDGLPAEEDTVGPARAVGPTVEAEPVRPEDVGPASAEGPSMDADPLRPEDAGPRETEVVAEVQETPLDESTAVATVSPSEPAALVESRDPAAEPAPADAGAGVNAGPGVNAGAEAGGSAPESAKFAKAATAPSVVEESSINYDDEGLLELALDEMQYRFDAGKQGTALCLSVRETGTYRWSAVGELKWDGRDLRSKAVDRKLLTRLSLALREFSQAQGE